jgi:hypothetical protein
MKKIVIFLGAIFFLFGCTIGTNGSTENEFYNLKQEFMVEESFNPNLNVMNSYINELSILRSKSDVSMVRVLDFELASAKAFYYFSKGLGQSSKINYFSDHCNSIDYRETISYLNLAVKNSNNAKEIILLPNEIPFLRENQQNVINEINIFAKELLSSIRSTC